VWRRWSAKVRDGRRDGVFPAVAYFGLCIRNIGAFFNSKWRLRRRDCPFTDLRSNLCLVACACWSITFPAHSRLSSLSFRTATGNMQHGTVLKCFHSIGRDEHDLLLFRVWIKIHFSSCNVAFNRLICTSLLVFRIFDNFLEHVGGGGGGQNWTSLATTPRFRIRQPLIGRIDPSFPPSLTRLTMKRVLLFEIFKFLPPSTLRLEVDLQVGSYRLNLHSAMTCSLPLVSLWS